MKRTQLIFLAAALVALSACKGNPNTTSGDSTGSGSGGARVPGMVSKDTTKHDSTTGKMDTSHLDTPKN
jgi:hypothetical protein